MPQAFAAVQRLRSSVIRAGVRATSRPPLSVKTPSSEYCSVLSRVSSIIILEYSIGKMKLDAWPVEPPGLGIGPLSTMTICVQPSRARWKARLLPTMPAPMMTALARPGMSFMEPLAANLRCCALPCYALPCCELPCCLFATGQDPRANADPGRAERVLLLDRDLLVDQAKVDALPLADKVRDRVDDDRQDVQGQHEQQRGLVVHAVGGVGEPLVEVVAEQPDGDPAGQRDDLDAEDLDPASRGRAPQVGLAPGQHHH